MSCPCAVLCSSSCVLLGVCPYFLYCLFSCSRLCFSVLFVFSPSQSCVWSCQCVVMSKSCFPKMLSAFNPPQRVLTSQCSSGDLLVFLACRTIIHAVTSNLLVRTSSVISFGVGGGRPGFRDNPERLSYGECMEGCRARSSSRSVGVELASCGVCPASSLHSSSCGVLFPAGTLLRVSLLELPVSSLLKLSVLSCNKSSLLQFLYTPVAIELANLLY